MPVKGRDSKTLEISPIDRLSQFFHSFPFSKGEANISSLWRFSPAGGRQREAGRDFQSAKVLPKFEFSKQESFEFGYLKLGFVWDLGFR